MMLSNVRIVLVETSHPGNIGAAARAMKTMMLADLRLVRPKSFPHEEATARAKGAEDVLESAVVCDHLGDALAECTFVVATSARARSLSWPTAPPRAAAQRVVTEAASGPVAVVFGREKSGLSNDELERCQLLVHIPANAEYASLNLAMAVQLLAYEIAGAARENPQPRPRETPLAQAEDLEYFYEHLERLLVRTEFLDAGNPRLLMRRLKRLFSRAEPDVNEINILRGVLSAAERHLR